MIGHFLYKWDGVLKAFSMLPGKIVFLEKDGLQTSDRYMSLLQLLEAHNAGSGDYHIRTEDRLCEGLINGCTYSWYSMFFLAWLSQNTIQLGF